MAQLNRDAAELAKSLKARCVTDITGFGLLGHLANIALASNVTIQIETSKLPVIDGVMQLINQGFTTGGATQNLKFVEPLLTILGDVSDANMDIMTDPQTSGGLAIFSKVASTAIPRIGCVVKDGAPGLILN
jgi:selenide,water dikinase